ncbi:hypothetical protein MCHI_001187 [Candidatus Magnetoovum chiemensis]|nr:hypothetical protein MCHI_001187 [Candidatus Magnetoovum chiemensis]
MTSRLFFVSSLNSNLFLKCFSIWNFRSVYLHINIEFTFDFLNCGFNMNQSTTRKDGLVGFNFTF